ncbi:hypothetical protein pb186bvf_002273 [Paramecium bursaria]
MGNFCEYHHKQDYDECLPKQLASHQLYNFSLYIDFGDIRNEDVDVIVVQTDVNLKLPPSLVSHSKVKSQLNRDLQNLREKQNYSHGDVVFSHAAELDIDFVFYCVLPSEEDQPAKLSKKQNQQFPTMSKSFRQKYQKQYIYDCTIKCLKLAEQKEIASICFPAMNLKGSNKFPIANIATMQMLAVKNFIEDNTTLCKNINTIRFCVDENQDVFRTAFEKVFLNYDNLSEQSDEDSIKKKIQYEQELEQQFKKPTEDDFLYSFGANYYDTDNAIMERKLSI